MGMGTIHLGARLPFENKLVLIDPAGRVIVSYRRVIPLADGRRASWFAATVGSRSLPQAMGSVATAICFDADFPEFIRQAAQGCGRCAPPAGQRLEIDQRLHFQMHAFRAIETGIPIVRAAASGLSSAFDPWGRVLGLSDYFAPGDGTLTVQVPFGGIRTVYGRMGDLFAWLCVAGLATALALGAMQHAGQDRHAPNHDRARRCTSALDVAARAAGRRDVALLDVVHHHAVGAEPPAQRPDRALHAARSSRAAGRRGRGRSTAGSTSSRSTLEQRLARRARRASRSRSASRPCRSRSRCGRRTPRPTSRRGSRGSARR